MEWAKRDNKKPPHYFTAPNGKVLAFAGLWEFWKKPEAGEVVKSCTIITGPPNEWMLQFTMARRRCLTRRTLRRMSCKAGIEVLRLAPKNALRQWEVSPRMNITGIGDDDVETIVPLEEDLR